MKYISIVKIPVSGCLNKQQLEKAMEDLNQYYLGDPHCNKLDENKRIVGKYDDHPNFKKLQNAHASLRRTFVTEIEIGIDAFGGFEVINT